MTEQERLLLLQQQKDAAVPTLAPVTQYALGQNPGNYTEGQRVTNAYNTYQSSLANKPGDYTESAGVIAARNSYEAAQANKPAAYVSPYQAQIDAAYKKILDRQPFKYDMNADTLYQQYKDQYTMQGKKAMQDTMGNAAALTGGYGNSYAATVGQQVNQDYMTRITDKLPEMYDRAYGKYRDESSDDINRLGISQGMDDRTYGRYRDTYGDWESEVAREGNDYNNERGFDYGTYRDRVGDWQWDVGRTQGDYNTERGFDLDMYRDAVSGFQNQRDYDFKKSEADYAKELDTRNFEYQKQQDAQAYALAMAKAAGGGGSSGSSGGGTKKGYSITADDLNELSSAYKTGGYWTFDNKAEELEAKGADPATLLALRDQVSKSTKMNIYTTGR